MITNYKEILQEINNGKRFALMVGEYFMRPVSKETIDEDCEMLSKWRADNQKVFKDDHPVTPEGTKEWFLKYYTNERMLFVIEGDESVGQMGLYRFRPESNSVEIDNVIRGNPEGKGVMSEALNMLVEWARLHFKARVILLQVDQENSHAIAFYKRNGFKVAQSTKFRGVKHYLMRHEVRIPHRLAQKTTK